jgi:hypothetical protein
MKITNKTYALLFTGQVVGAELPPSAPELRAWVAVYPYLRGKHRCGPDADTAYRGIGNPSFDVYRFEARKSSLEAGYDVVGELINERRAAVENEEGFDKSVEDLERLLESWSIDPSSLGALDDDYPL